MVKSSALAYGLEVTKWNVTIFVFNALRLIIKLPRFKDYSNGTEAGKTKKKHIYRMLSLIKKIEVIKLEKKTILQWFGRLSNNQK